MEPLGVVIVGAGTIGKVHAEALAHLPAGRLVAVVDPIEPAGRALAAQYQAAWLPDLAAALDRDDVQVVNVTTPSGLHAEQTVLAAAAGKHVITEKPMATTLAGADRMIAACRAAGVALAVIFQNRFLHDTLLLKRAVEAGRFGRIVLGSALIPWYRSAGYYQASGGWRGTWALDGGGALMNQGIHTIDLLQWLLGPAASVMGRIATLTHEIETEDTASATVQFASGALGTIQGTTSADQDWPVRLDIIGTGGRAVLEGQHFTLWQPAEPTGDELLTAEDRTLLAGPATAVSPGSVVHARQLAAIFTALQRGETPPVPGQEARKAVELILAIYASSRDDRPVPLPLA